MESVDCRLFLFEFQSFTAFQPTDIYYNIRPSQEEMSTDCFSTEVRGRFFIASANVP